MLFFHVISDEISVGFLIKTKYEDLLMSGKRYKLDNTRWESSIRTSLYYLFCFYELNLYKTNLIICNWLNEIISCFRSLLHCLKLEIFSAVVGFGQLQNKAKVLQYQYSVYRDYLISLCGFDCRSICDGFVFAYLGDEDAPSVATFLWTNKQTNAPMGKGNLAS